MKFCSVCGTEVRVGIPEGDNRPRHICDHCGTIHYHNPKVVAGCIAHWEDRVLMCRRAIEPRHGLWTVPAGFMERFRFLFVSLELTEEREIDQAEHVERCQQRSDSPHDPQCPVPGSECLPENFILGEKS